MNKPKCAAAVKLGRLNKGKLKNLSLDERQRRAAQMKLNQTKRWRTKPKPLTANSTGSTT